MNSDGDANTKRMILSLSAKAADLSARVTQLEAKVAKLSETPEDRAKDGLAKAEGKLPAYARALTPAEITAKAAGE